MPTQMHVSTQPPIEQLRKRILGVGDKIHREGMRKATLAAISPMLKDMRSLVPVDHGALKASLGYRTLSQRKAISRGLQITRGDYGVEVGVVKEVADPGYRRSPGKVIPQTYKAFFVEYGTEPHSVAKGARRDRNKLQDKGPYHPGTQAQPFVRIPYYDAESEFAGRFSAALDEFLQDI